jgi:hypothetical protein
MLLSDTVLAPRPRGGNRVIDQLRHLVLIAMQAPEQLTAADRRSLLALVQASMDAECQKNLAARGGGGGGVISPPDRPRLVRIATA